MSNLKPNTKKFERLSCTLSMFLDNMFSWLEVEEKKKELTLSFMHSVVALGF